MATSAIVTDSHASLPRSGHQEPLQLCGALDAYEHFDMTPAIGCEFPTANLAEWILSKNADELIRDLAITSEVTSRHFFLKGN